MTLKPHKNGWVFGAITCLLLTACDVRGGSGGSQKTLSPEVQAKVDALAKKSLTQLSYVPAGGFWLGDPGALMTEELKNSGAVLGPDAKPSDSPTAYNYDQTNKVPRWVTFDAFSIQQYKVTYGDFDVYVAANGLPKHPPVGDDEGFGDIWVKARKGDDYPAGVNWEQARGYCQWLGKVTGQPFDLPTEAQWEFAASNGRKTHWEPMPTDNGIFEEGRNTPTFKQREEMIGHRGVLYPIGRFPGSMLKLHDLVGNGYEWTLDWYAPDTYETMTQTHNPTGPATGTEKVLRGSPTDESMSGFPHTLRGHKPPTGFKFKGRLWEYSSESFRCVVNSSTALPNTYTAGPPPVRNVLLDREKRP